MSGANVFCSGCCGVFPEQGVHVIPYFNESVADFVTTYRCEACWLSALDDTQRRLESAGLEELARMARFFERHNITILDFRRGDAPEALRPVLLQMIELTRRGVLKLNI